MVDLLSPGFLFSGQVERRRRPLPRLAPAWPSSCALQHHPQRQPHPVEEVAAAICYALHGWTSTIPAANPPTPQGH